MKCTRILSEWTFTVLDMILDTKYYDNYWGDWSTTKEDSDKALHMLTSLPNTHVLIDQGLEIDGVNLWGSPWGENRDTFTLLLLCLHAIQCHVIFHTSLSVTQLCTGMLTNLYLFMQYPNMEAGLPASISPPRSCMTIGKTHFQSTLMSW